MIVSSAGVRMKRAVRFEFVASNNEAEYEALLMGLKICHEAGAKTLSTFFDSQLIVGQVNGEFEAKDDSMKMHLQQVRELVKKFEQIHIGPHPKIPKCTSRFPGKTRQLSRNIHGSRYYLGSTS